jgi:saccharopine dehydrogenase-like NADP-dependent oxidoreductase
MLVFVDKHIYELDGKTYEHTAHMIDKGRNHLQTAISRTVGLPAAIAVKLILEGEISTRGVILPVLEEVYEPVLSELATMGIEYSHAEVEIGA